MKDPKAEVIHYLKHDRTLLGGRNLYNQLPTKNLALQRQMARWTDSAINIERLCYELAKAVGLEQRLLKIYTQNPVVQINAIEVDIDTDDTGSKDDGTTLDDALLAFDTENTKWNTGKALAKALGIKTSRRKKNEIWPDLEEARRALVAKQLAEIPGEVKASIKLRDQFPFLREKDCPDSLKLLVNELITSYEDFKDNQPKLHDLLQDDEAKALVDVVLKDYIENKQAWAELEHYNTTGQVLGEHPLFEILEEKERITRLETPDLAKEIKNLENNIGRNKKKGNTELVDKQEQYLAHAQAELAKRS
ncbi:hypothetical protein L0P88_04005 [Muricauda sp. SCSIO 64092]|uniref:hypothetical protein n=1 Tax=Allomuricauda sp. SCSIO 64092 TaxID=2908842 RepID=UPI001FF1DA3B|nr:hypothetical protein [Muricauda sp. SCSIO 64092]UOY07718.1 hypothetical protein L0P88_04005 [Muricauda sp. SCSIO 64092]